MGFLKNKNKARTWAALKKFLVWKKKQFHLRFICGVERLQRLKCVNCIVEMGKKPKHCDHISKKMY